MAGSTLDPDNPGQRRRRRNNLKGHASRALDSSDSSDTGSGVIGAPPADERMPSGRAPEQAQRREIAENAYYRSEKRGFGPGHEERDWLEAEAEIKSRGKKRR